MLALLAFPCLWVLGLLPGPLYSILLLREQPLFMSLSSELTQTSEVAGPSLPYNLESVISTAFPPGVCLNQPRPFPGSRSSHLLSRHYVSSLEGKNC